MTVQWVFVDRLNVPGPLYPLPCVTGGGPCEEGAVCISRGGLGAEEAPRPDRRSEVTQPRSRTVPSSHAQGV